MKKLLFSISILLILSSCKKSSKDENPDTSQCPIKEIKSDVGSTYLTYNSNKVVRYESKINNVLYETVTLSYETNKITKTSKLSDGTINVYIYTLNTNGLISSAEHRHQYGVNTAIYTYNSLDQLISIKNVIGTTTFNYTLQYSNGNMIAGNRGTFQYNSLENYQNLVGLTHPLSLDNDYLEEFGDFAILSNGNFGANPKNLVSSKSGNISLVYEKSTSGNINSITVAGNKLTLVKNCN